MISVKIYRPEPYTSAGSYILAEIGNRVVKLAQEHGESVTPFVSMISRLWGLDPAVLALAALDGKGNVKGHALALLHEEAAYLWQPRVDEPTEGDTIGEFVTLAEEWLKVYNSAVVKEGLGVAIPGLTMLARRADPKWAKKYNFTTKHYEMFRPLGG